MVYADATNRVILVVGAPASGKTTLTRKLSGRVETLHILRYGELLFDSLRSANPSLTYEDLRANSSSLVTPGLLRETDAVVVEDTARRRVTGHVIIENHAVTRERYGLRVTLYDQEQIRRLALDAIVLLECSPDETIRRLAQKPEGRLSVARLGVSLHSELQRQVALLYSIKSGCPLYVVDSGQGVAAVEWSALQVLEQLGVIRNG